MTAPTPMPEHLTEIRQLLSQNDSTSVTQGIALLQSLADRALWALFAADVELDYGLDIMVGSEIEAHVTESFRADVAFWALRETGQLQGKTQLRLSECRLLSDLRPLAGLTALESLDLSGCKGLTSLDGIQDLPNLRALELSDCSSLDLTPLRQVSALTSLRLGNWETLTSLAPLYGLRSLESLDLSGCDGLLTLDGLAELPALREVRLDGCHGLTSLAGLPTTVCIARTPTAEFGEDLFVARHEHRTLWMSESEGQLRLNGLTVLSEPEATALIAAAGTLELNGLETIPDAVLFTLARQVGRLSLNGLQSLSTAAAATLAKTHIGDLVLRGLETPSDADEVFAAHVGRVSLGAAFQYIDVGRFDASRDIETFGAREDASLLTVPVEAESTFTLKHDGAWPAEVKVGILDDEVVAALFEEGAGSLEWTEHDGIASAYGVTTPATTIVLPDGTEEPITLRHWPRSRHLVRLAQQESARGDFVHVTTSLEKGVWNSYSLTLSEGVFDLSRVRVVWAGDFADGYEYVHEDGSTEYFESDDEISTRGKGVDIDIYFNTGTSLISIDMDDLQGELEEAGVDVEDIDAVRAHLLEREDTDGDEEAAADEADSDDEDDDDSEPSDEDESEDSWKTEEVQRVAEHLEMWGFGPGDIGWLGRVLKGYALGDPIVTPPDLGPHYSRIRSVIQLTDGTVVSSADEGVLRFWDPTSLRCIRSVDTGKTLGPLLALSGGRFLADIDDTCNVWDFGASSPSRTLDHPDSSLRAMRRISDDSVATSDGTGTIRIWDTSLWTIRAARTFEGLKGFGVIDAEHLLVQVATDTDDGSVSGITIWNFRTDRIESGPFESSVPRSTAVLPGRGWATTDGGTRIIVRDVAGTVLRTIDALLQTADVMQSVNSFAFDWCGSCALSTLSRDALLLLGARQSDGALVVLRCDVETGACRELFAEPRDAETSLTANEMSLDPDGLLLLLPASNGENRTLVVRADPDSPAQTLIMPRGREREGLDFTDNDDITDESDLRGAVLLQDGRLATWGWLHDHAIRLWTPDGVTAGAMGTVSRFWTRDPLESTLFGDPE